MFAYVIHFNLAETVRKLCQKFLVDKIKIIFIFFKEKKENVKMCSF